MQCLPCPKSDADKRVMPPLCTRACLSGAVKPKVGMTSVLPPLSVGWADTAGLDVRCCPSLALSAPLFNPLFTVVQDPQQHTGFAACCTIESEHSRFSCSATSLGGRAMPRFGGSIKVPHSGRDAAFDMLCTPVPGGEVWCMLDELLNLHGRPLHWTHHGIVQLT